MNKRVVVIFPKFERLDLIEQVRRLFDPLASSVGAHITLMAPFESDMESEELRHHIEQVGQNTQPFRIVLQGITGHEGEYLFLNVKRGNDELIELRDRLYEGQLKSHLLQQYTYIPHLTLGRLPNEELFLKALEAVRELDTAFQTYVSEISVYSIQSNGERLIEFSVSL